jgi:hypothetical protein
MKIKIVLQGFQHSGMELGLHEPMDAGRWGIVRAVIRLQSPFYKARRLA